MSSWTGWRSPNWQVRPIQPRRDEPDHLGMRSLLPITELLLVLTLIKLLLVLPEFKNWLVGMPPPDEQLVFAAWMGDESSVEELISEGSMVQSESAESALALAAMAGRTRVVKRLLELGVNANGTDNVGCTPLQYAVTGKRHKIVRLLLERGADPRMSIPHNGFVPLEISASADRENPG
jgi:hypothetical protein